MPGKDREGRQARRIAVTRRQPAQLSLLEPRRIAGFDRQPELMSPVEERSLVEQLSTLAFEPFEFHGYLGHRRVASFGVRHGFDDGKVHAAPEIPHFLLPLRQLAAAFAGIDASALQHALVTDYRPGAGIGWHRDRPVFQDVIGVSLLSPCRFRLRRMASRCLQPITNCS